MTGEEFWGLLGTLRWSYREAGRKLGCTDAYVRQMAQGTRTVPDDLGKWLKGAAARIGPLLDEIEHQMKAMPAPPRRTVEPRKGK